MRSLPTPLQERVSAWREWVREWRGVLAAEGLSHEERRAIQVGFQRQASLGQRLLLGLL